MNVTLTSQVRQGVLGSVCDDAPSCCRVHVRWYLLRISGVADHHQTLADTNMHCSPWMIAPFLHIRDMPTETVNCDNALNSSLRHVSVRERNVSNV